MADTKMKLCGLSRVEDIEVANRLKPDYIGFVFAKKSRRYVEPNLAAKLRAKLDPSIQAVGVFVNAEIEMVSGLVHQGIIQVAQLHGKEDADYVQTLQKRLPDETKIFQAFRIDTKEDVERASQSLADYILLDSGEGGTGTVFNWELIQNIERPYFLAGGLDVENVTEAVTRLHPYGVDVSSGIETDGQKDSNKMEAFVLKVREA